MIHKGVYMKRMILLCAVIMIFAASLYSQTQSESQTQDQRRFSFQIKPLSYITMLITNGVEESNEVYYLQFEFEFQYVLQKYFTLSLSPYFGTNNSRYYGADGYTNEYIKDISYGISAGLLYKPWGGGLKGMYVGLYPVLGMIHVKYYDINDTLLNIGIMAESGYQWVFKNGFTLALGGGIGFSDLIRFPDTKGTYKKTHFLTYPFDLSIRASLGYSF
jgi:ABC-type cobalt transport system substrate-binding protein